MWKYRGNYGVLWQVYEIETSEFNDASVIQQHRESHECYQAIRLGQSTLHTKSLVCINDWIGDFREGFLMLVPSWTPWTSQDCTKSTGWYQVSEYLQISRHFLEYSTRRKPSRSWRWCDHLQFETAVNGKPHFADFPGAVLFSHFDCKIWGRPSWNIIFTGTEKPPNPSTNRISILAHFGES